LPRPRVWAKSFFEALSTRFPNRESDRVLIIVDQMEELFTQQIAGNGAAQSQFAAHVLEMLQVLATDAAFRDDPRFHYVLTLRSEFRFRCRISDVFWSFISMENGAKEKPRDMRLDELDFVQWREAIKGPAERAGAYFEPGLVGAILKDVYRQRGSMPLLQHALEQLWLRAEGACLSLAAYETSGGVSGALGKNADEALDRLCNRSANHEVVCRSLFLRLISFGAGVPDTRRRALISELDFGPALDPIRDEILKELQRKECRLVSRDGDAIEVTHEALIRECNTVILWLEEARLSCDLQLFRQLTDAAQAWYQGGRSRQDLWPFHRIRRFYNDYSSAGHPQ
jgi:hypothetical protein